jgi:hypothetical protein
VGGKIEPYDSWLLYIKEVALSSLEEDEANYKNWAFVEYDKGYFLFSLGDKSGNPNTFPNEVEEEQIGKDGTMLS